MISEQGAADSQAIPSEIGGKVGYGVDQPTAILQLVVAAVIIIVTGFVVAFTVFRQDIALGIVFLFGMPIGGFLILAVAASLYWSSKLGKPREIARLMREIPWGGSEIAVDVGCGRGAMMMDAAVRFDQGLAIGVDQWKKTDLSGNEPSSVWANARATKVLGKVVVVEADARNLPFADASVDVGMSSMAIHLVGGRSAQEAALKEIVRIVKPGGRIAILDAGHGGEYAGFLKEDGIVDVHVARLRFRSFPPLHSVTGRKPFVG